MFLSSLTLYITYSNFVLISVMRWLLQFYGTRMGAFLTRCMGSSVVLLSDMIWHPIYVLYTYKTIYASSQKPSRKAKICRCHFLPSSIEGCSSNVWQCAPNCSPHTDNDSGAIRAGLRARAKEKWGAGRTLFESAFYSFSIRKSARVVRKRP